MRSYTHTTTDTPQSQASSKASMYYHRNITRFAYTISCYGNRTNLQHSSFTERSYSYMLAALVFNYLMSTAYV